MAGLTTTGKNAALAAVGITHVSLHTADPGDSGASELSGGSYARLPITWNAPAAGNLDSADQPAFDVPGGNTINHVGYWTALTGGECRAGGTITPETFGADGTYTLTDADISIS